MQNLTFSDFTAHSNPLFIKLKLLKVRDVVKLSQLRLVYDFVAGQLPVDLMTLFRLSSDVHPGHALTSSANSLIHIPTINTKTYGNQSVKYSCARLWNETFRTGSVQVCGDRNKNILLSKIRNVYNLKNALKRHYLYGYTLD